MKSILSMLKLLKTTEDLIESCFMWSGNTTKYMEPNQEDPTKKLVAVVELFRGTIFIGWEILEFPTWTELRKSMADFLIIRTADARWSGLNNPYMNREYCNDLFIGQLTIDQLVQLKTELGIGWYVSGIHGKAYFSEVVKGLYDESEDSDWCGGPFSTKELAELWVSENHDEVKSTHCM